MPDVVRLILVRVDEGSVSQDAVSNPLRLAILRISNTGSGFDPSDATHRVVPIDLLKKHTASLRPLHSGDVLTLRGVVQQPGKLFTSGSPEGSDVIHITHWVSVSSVRQHSVVALVSPSPHREGVFCVKGFGSKSANPSLHDAACSGDSLESQLAKAGSVWDFSGWQQGEQGEYPATRNSTSQGPPGISLYFSRAEVCLRNPTDTSLTLTGATRLRAFFTLSPSQPPSLPPGTDLLSPLDPLYLRRPSASLCVLLPGGMLSGLTGAARCCANLLLSVEGARLAWPRGGEGQPYPSVVLRHPEGSAAVEKYLVYVVSNVFRARQSQGQSDETWVTLSPKQLSAGLGSLARGGAPSQAGGGVILSKATLRHVHPPFAEKGGYEGNQISRHEGPNLMVEDEIWFDGIPTTRARDGGGLPAVVPGGSRVVKVVCSQSGAVWGTPLACTSGDAALRDETSGFPNPRVICVVTSVASPEVGSPLQPTGEGEGDVGISPQVSLRSLHTRACYTCSGGDLSTARRSKLGRGAAASHLKPGDCIAFSRFGFTPGGSGPAKAVDFSISEVLDVFPASRGPEGSALPGIGRCSGQAQGVGVGGDPSKGSNPIIRCERGEILRRSQQREGVLREIFADPSYDEPRGEFVLFDARCVVVWVGSGGCHVLLKGHAANGVANGGSDFKPHHQKEHIFTWDPKRQTSPDEFDVGRYLQVMVGSEIHFAYIWFKPAGEATASQPDPSADPTQPPPGPYEVTDYLLREISGIHHPDHPGCDVVILPNYPVEATRTLLHDFLGELRDALHPEDLPVGLLPSPLEVTSLVMSVLSSLTLLCCHALQALKRRRRRAESLEGLSGFYSLQQDSLPADDADSVVFNDISVGIDTTHSVLQKIRSDELRTPFPERELVAKFSHLLFGLVVLLGVKRVNTLEGKGLKSLEIAVEPLDAMHMLDQRGLEERQAARRDFEAVRRRVKKESQDEAKRVLEARKVSDAQRAERLGIPHLPEDLDPWTSTEDFFYIYEGLLRTPGGRTLQHPERPDLMLTKKQWADAFGSLRGFDKGEEAGLFLLSKELGLPQRLAWFTKEYVRGVVAPHRDEFLRTLHGLLCRADQGGEEELRFCPRDQAPRSQVHFMKVYRSCREWEVAGRKPPSLD